MASAFWKTRRGSGVGPQRQPPWPGEKIPEKEWTPATPAKKIHHKYLAYENLLQYYYLTIATPLSSRGKR
jgi:hypothetical protein